MHHILQASQPEHYEAALKLFNEYASWLNIDLSFQHFESEKRSLPIVYGAPDGCILLCESAGNHIGSVAVRRFDHSAAELKRMYILPAYRKQGIAQQLLEHALDFAKKVGYNKILLDTLNTMHPAMSLYKKNGFKEIPAYYHNPEPTAVYFEKLF